MPPAPEVTLKRSRTRVLIAFAVVGVTVLGVWKFIDYRTQPPAPPAAVANDQM